jgi:hypothetical protein
MNQLEIRDRGIGIEESVNHEKIEVNGREDSHKGTEGTENNKILNPPCPPCKQPEVAPCLREISSELAALDPNAVTPLQALALVSGWKKRLADGGARPRAAKAAAAKAVDKKPADSTPSLFD